MVPSYAIQSDRLDALPIARLLLEGRHSEGISLMSRESHDPA
jgi:hypothetical protein